MDHHPEIPGYVEQALAQAGIDRKQVRAAAHTDLDRQGSFRAAWLCVDDHALYIFAQTKRGKEPRRVVPFIKKRDKGQFFAGIDDRNFSGEMELIEHYDLEMLKSLRCEYFVGSIAVIATIGEDRRILCRASKAKGADLNAFCRLVTNLIENPGIKRKMAGSGGRSAAPNAAAFIPILPAPYAQTASTSVLSLSECWH